MYYYTISEDLGSEWYISQSPSSKKIWVLLLDCLWGLPILETSSINWACSQQIEHVHHKLSMFTSGTEFDSVPI